VPRMRPVTNPTAESISEIALLPRPPVTARADVVRRLADLIDELLVHQRVVPPAPDVGDGLVQVLTSRRTGR
jgi:hypothetical protein